MINANAALAQQNKPDLMVSQWADVITAEVGNDFTATYHVTVKGGGAANLGEHELTITLQGDLKYDVLGAPCNDSGVNPGITLVCTTSNEYLNIQIMPLSAGEVISKASIAAVEAEVLLGNNYSEMIVHSVALGAVISEPSQEIDYQPINYAFTYDVDGINGQDLIVLSDNAGETYLNNGAGEFELAPDYQYIFTAVASDVTGLVIGNIDPADAATEFTFSTGEDNNFLAYKLNISPVQQLISHHGKTIIIPANTPIFQSAISLIATGASDGLDSHDIQLVDFASENSKSSVATDLLIANAGTDQSGIYLNKNGIYASVFNDTDELGARDSRKIAAVDLNNDSLLDIVIANFNGPNQIHFAANGNLPWLDLTRFENETLLGDANGLTTDFVVGEFGGPVDTSGESLIDLVFVESGGSSGEIGRLDQLSLLINQNDGEFMDPDVIARSNGIESVHSVDVDSNGTTDLLLHNLDGSNQLYLNFGQNLTKSIFALETDPDSILLPLDLNNDGLLDVITASKTGGGIKVYLTDQPSGGALLIGGAEQALVAPYGGGGGVLWWAVVALLIVLSLRIYQRKLVH
ncbi:FG-GAP repeat domain-containing protein [Pelagibaculum spongiae]|nr:VCBS repeat-containing protein [Pelagibaculum spongiae]